MAKYLLQNLEGETLDTKSKKDAAIKVATDQGLLAFRVVTDKGTVVYEQAESTILNDLADLEDETLFYETLEFPGNYSIVTAPGALEIAEAAGVPGKSENIKGSLTRKVFLGGDDMDKAKAVATLIPQAVDEALRGLKEWQKKNLDRRRSLTDMQRYVEHREFIAKQMHKTALAVKKNGIPA